MTTCPTCDRRLVVIDMAIDDADVAMYSCNACDQRWWDANGLTTSLSSVLDLVAHSGRRRG